MKSYFIAQMSPGDTIDDIFAARVVDLKEYSGGKMITVELVDKSGRIGGVIWNGTSDLMEILKPGKVYRTKGTVTTYKGKNQFTIETIEPAAEFDPSDFLPEGKFSFDELGQRLTDAVGKIGDEDYKSLLNELFSGDYRRDFLRGVGGKLWHHNYVGGLAEHTLAIFDICLDLSGRYDELNRDLLLTGALLHDIGKIKSYSLASVIDYTDTGRLLGHIVEGDQIVRDVISQIPDFPEEKKILIRHLILSHQGTPAQASPVPPMIPEGMALYTADLLDSKLAALRRIKNKEHRPGIRWSNFVNLLDRHIYFGNHGGENV
ncbi:MAG: HD domain-containing protein [candidate division Zixibacteria bacterium]